MCRNSISILFNRELSTFYFSDNLFSRLFGYLTHMLLWCISSAFCDCFSFSHVVMDASPADYVFGFIIDNWHMYLLGQGDWITNCMTSLLGRGPGWHLTHPNDWKKHGRGKPASSVSTGVLDLGKEKSAAKPPGKPSIQSKTIVIPDLRPVDTITPIFETRTNRWICYQPGEIFKFQCILSKEGN
ncbi:uncharacterized protein LOC132040032 isoform X1 [Lycium ferocissimum]|uniref:uncharacterized protein LOC132040032 isoform X1 n=1 Tax=Lycium ferocissimum TaxID=112874 RepID=UPI002815C0EE|nr:uncharacterized protein LOC132040032 isoform X1 [Lycium ferocissimum]XP_059286617.1 uncharacterized protein LOC132040032 isoform X1 [Lycium ferocissimum]XP_059286618.1 uncharacterized protein LOC132040032 isoform X1 [Lycium ferocissimum]